MYTIQLLNLPLLVLMLGTYMYMYMLVALPFVEIKFSRAGNRIITPQVGIGSRR